MLDALASRIAEILVDRPEVLEAYLFGSHATGTAREHSDIDVAVYVDPALCDEGAFGYAASLTTSLMQGLGQNEVDVVVLNRAPPMLYHRVLRDGIRLVSRDLCATTRRAATALSRYYDYLPQLEKIRAAHRARMDRGEFGR